MLSDGFVRGVPKYPFRTLIPTRDDAIKVLADNGIIGRGYNGSQQTGYFFYLLPLAHILWRRSNTLGCRRLLGEVPRSERIVHLTNRSAIPRPASPFGGLRENCHSMLSHFALRFQIQ